MMKRYMRGVALAGLIATLFAATDSADAQEIRLQKAVVASGGGNASNGETTMHYTIGQPVVGMAANGVHRGTFGFWHGTFQVSSVSETEGAGSVTGVSVTPNPIAATGEIRLELARSGNVEVLLYNAAGQLERDLYNGSAEAGMLSLELDAEGLASGAYFVAVRVPGAVVQHPISIVK